MANDEKEQAIRAAIEKLELLEKEVFDSFLDLQKQIKQYKELFNMLTKDNQTPD